MIDPRGHAQVARFVMPLEWKGLLEPRENQVMVFESVALLFAIFLWGELLRGQAVLVFMDKDVATSVVRGYRKASNLAWIAGQVWDVVLFWGH